METSLKRRTFLAGLVTTSALLVSGCTSSGGSTGGRRIGRAAAGPIMPAIDPEYLAMYGPRPQERFPLPAVDLRQVPQSHWRRVVPDPTGERPGTLVVDTAGRYLYLVQEGGQAIRYGVGIGREGFAWSGRGKIGRKAEWPTWTPPSQMIERQPELEEWRNGMPPGLDNPLGARALYIHAGGRDTLYRLHGTPEYWSIGQAVSSGCVRLLNHDVIDLYGRVPAGASIIVQ